MRTNWQMVTGVQRGTILVLCTCTMTTAKKEKAENIKSRTSTKSLSSRLDSALTRKELAHHMIMSGSRRLEVTDFGLSDLILGS